MNFKKINDYSKLVNAQFEKAVPKEQYIEKLNALYGKSYSDLSWRIEIQYESDLGWYLAALNLCSKGERLTTLGSFYTNNFPGCCAMQQLHSFTINESAISQEHFNIFMDIVLKTLLPQSMHFATGRLLVAMVQRTYGHNILTLDGKKLPRENGKSIGYASEGVQPIPLETANIQYVYYYNYFQQQKKVNTTLMYNQNTGNVVHFLEVIFDRSKF